MDEQHCTARVRWFCGTMSGTVRRVELIWPKYGLPDELVEIAPGVKTPVLIPRVQVRREDGDDLPYDLELSVRYRNGRYVIERMVAMQVESGPPVDGAGLRLVPIPGLIFQVVARFVWNITPSQDGALWTEFLGVDPEIAAAGPTDDVLRQVAVVYAVAYACDQPPTKAVTATFGLARSTAGRWVARARERGFLGPTTPGRAGEHG